MFYQERELGEISTRFWFLSAIGPDRGHKHLTK